MHEHTPYNLLNSEMFESDDAAYEYQYEQGNVGAQSVVPVHMRNNPEVKIVTSPTTHKERPSELISEVTSPFDISRMLSAPSDKKRPFLPPSKIRSLSDKELNALNPKQLQSRIQAIQHRRAYLFQQGKSKTFENRVLTKQLEKAVKRQQHLHLLSLKARKTLKDSVIKGRVKRMGLHRGPSHLTGGTKIAPLSPLAPKPAPAPAELSTEADLTELSDKDEVKAKLNEILLNTADPNYAQVKKIYDMALNNPANDCYEFHLTELIRAILSNSPVPTIDLTLCGRISDSAAADLCFTILADPSHPQYKLVTNLYNSGATARARGANEDCIFYHLITVLNQIYYGLEVTVPDTSECESEHQATLTELRELMNSILANPSDPDYDLVNSSYQEILAAAGTENEEMEEFELEEILRDLYEARHAKTNPIEEGFFEKNKWYIAGGAALLGGAAILYFTKRK